MVFENVRVLGHVIDLFHHLVELFLQVLSHPLLPLIRLFFFTIGIRHVGGNQEPLLIYILVLMLLLGGHYQMIL